MPLKKDPVVLLPENGWLEADIPAVVPMAGAVVEAPYHSASRDGLLLLLRIVKGFVN
jgi:hypothetical protein